MAKKVNQDSTDAALAYIKDRVTRQAILTGEPADFAGVAALTLGDVAVGSADVTISSGGGGRRYTVAQKAGVDIDTSGTATHTCLVNDTDSELLDVTTCPSTEVSQGGTATINAHSRVIADPT
jgi:hypothetical protein